MDAQPKPIKTALQLLWPVALVLFLLALLLGAAAGGAVWLLRSEDGTRWLLAQLPGVEATGVHGALLSERFEADKLRITWSGGKASVTITGLQGDGLVWAWRPQSQAQSRAQPQAWVGLDAAHLSAREVVVDSGPASGKPLMLPASLALPVRVTVAELRIETLQVDTFAAMRRVGAKVALGAGDGHAVEQLQLEWDRLLVHGQARIAAAKPFALAAQFDLAPLPPGEAFAATLRAAGPLERLELAGSLRGTARAGHAAPSADLKATLQPFAPWPLAALSAQTQALDLAALASSAPETRLSGQVQVQSQSLQAPIGATIQLDNALPGRWDEHRLPLRRLVLELQTNAAHREQVDLREFDLVLGSGARAAGRWHGRGQWLSHVLELDSTLSELQPQFLDGRAPAMMLSGPFAVTLRGLPSPNPSATTAPPPLAIDVRSTLDGRLDAAPQPVHVVLEASADEQHVELRQLRAQAGAALAQAKASAQRNAAGAWQLSTAGSLTDFDPLPWWPGEAGSAWRQGPHRLSGLWQLDLRLPAAARTLAPLALLQSLSGSGKLNVSESVLAGVPLALELALGQLPASDGPPSSLHGELHLGSNKLTIDGRADPAGTGSSDRWKFDLDAGTLATLAPLLRLDPALAAWAPRGGSASASVTAQGRWPQLRTEGQATLLQLQAGELTVAKGSASWHLATGGEEQQPLEMQAEVSGMRLGKQRAELLRAELHGTWHEHKLLVTGALPLAPPPVVEQLLGVRALSGTRAQLQAEGQWQPASAGGGRWRGHIARLAVGAWDGGALGAPSADSAANWAANWADARDLSAELQFDTHGSLVRVQAAPGRLKLADAVSLRWDEVIVDLQGAAENIELRADIDTFAVAPLLARMQPGMGWAGDLKLAASVKVRAAERFDADIVFERRDGDLHITDEGGTQLLGLTDLRVALAAHDGQWVFTQALAGRTIGEMTGAVSVKTTPQRRWPTADSPLDGVIEAHVANLGVWGTWVPPGWRLAGELRTSATIGGRFGAPEYTGSVRGNDIGVRNLLQGVNISQGTVAIQLNGAAAKIEHFTLKGGDGTLNLSGGAEFGATPNAKLHLVAERFRVLGRIDRQLSASGSADLALQADQVKLDGKFKVDEGLFDTTRGDAPGLDDDVTVHRAGDVEKPTEAAAAPKPRRNVVVAVDVDLGEKLRVRGRGLDTALRGQLRITTPGGRLAIQGTVSTEQGTYQAYGQKLEIDRGIVAFSGSADNPRLDILALRQNTDTRVGVAISGNLLTPRVRLYSETDMSDTEKLSWLVLGRAPDGLGRTDTALLQRAAVALLSGEGEAPTDALMRSLGIDELSLRQSDGEVRETVISLGKQLSRRWYVGYERGVNATTGTWQLIYRIAQRFTLRAQSGLENSLDIIWVWKRDDVALVPGMTKSKAAPP